MILDTQRPLIQRALWLDGVVSLAAGLLCLPFLSGLAESLGVGTPVIFALAGFMAGYGGLLLWLARRLTTGAQWPWGLVVGNGAWVLASVWLAFSGWIEPTPVGRVILLGQAAIVLGLTELQWFGMRRSTLRAGVA